MMDQSKIANKDNNNLFITMDNSIDNTHDDKRFSRNKSVKFKKL